jgi:hypothetical protein
LSIPIEQQSPHPGSQHAAPAIRDNQADTSAPPIPRDQQSPYPGSQRAAAAPAIPDNEVDTSANAIRGPPRLWDRATTLAFFGSINVATFMQDAAPLRAGARISSWG